MKIFIGSAIILILLAIGVWFMLSPLFSKIGSLTEKKSKLFKEKWEETKDE
ncbi:hypothetical protein [Peribacillus sp. SCS-155]|uniref:hypothetical protein n=1 Tax=Peribacillus sedimenti TaxID=3115297 RepID=UPI00390652CF